MEGQYHELEAQETFLNMSLTQNRVYALLIISSSQADTMKVSYIRNTLP